MRRERETIRRLLAVGACASAFLVTEARPGAAASPEDCRAFHRECTEARAAGYEDVGICNVERLECPTAPGPGNVKPRRDGKDEQRPDPECTVGERSIGP